MRCLIVLATACGSPGSSSPPPTPTTSSPPSTIVEAPGPGPWTAVTDGGVRLTNPGRWACAVSTREPNVVMTKRTTCLVPIMEVEYGLLGCPERWSGQPVTYDADGRMTSVAGVAYKWNGDALVARGTDPVSLNRVDGMLRFSFSYTSHVELDAQQRPARIRTWVGDNVAIPPASTTMFVYAGDDLVSLTKESYRLPDDTVDRWALTSCANLGRPAALVPPAPGGAVGIPTPGECQSLAEHVAELDLEDPAKRPDHAAYVRTGCRYWGPKMRACLAKATTSDARLACPVELAPFGPSRTCAEAAAAKAILVGRSLAGITADETAVLARYTAADCAAQHWEAGRRSCVGNATDYAMAIDCPTTF